ncbi:MAG: superoxide dismutase [Marinilabiliales bacterium]|nr:MAG: superoxide dismutase [Marinilabiliales bacterium]
MDKRTFIKKGLLGLGGIISAPLMAKGQGTYAANRLSQEEPAGSKFSLPSLPYSYDALEPHIDAQTMNIHHTRHHQAYVNNLNNALKGTGSEEMTLEDINRNISSFNMAVRNNGGGHFNHNLFWEVMSPNGGGRPSGELMSAINGSFGSFEKFRELFSNAAATRFGSGWAWLIASEGRLKVTSTPNQDNPLMDIIPAGEQGVPVLGIDVWEHAYYLRYQNRRGDYISAFWEVINWNAVAEKLKSA